MSKLKKQRGAKSLDPGGKMDVYFTFQVSTKAKEQFKELCFIHETTPSIQFRKFLFSKIEEWERQG